MKLSRWGYGKLIEEDIAWLRKVTPGVDEKPFFEKGHIIAVLEASIENEYPETPAERAKKEN